MSTVAEVALLAVTMVIKIVARGVAMVIGGSHGDGDGDVTSIAINSNTDGGSCARIGRGRRQPVKRNKTRSKLHEDG